jgi:hypothetical protein
MGIYGLVSANGFSEYITGKDMFGNELSEAQRQSSLLQSIIGPALIAAPFASQLAKNSKLIREQTLNKAHELATKTKAEANRFMEDVKGGARILLNPHGNYAFSSNVPSIPVNVMDTSSVKKEMDRVVSKFSVSVDGKGTEKDVHGANGAKKLNLEDFTKEILETKPMNSPIPEKWYKKGGNISIDDHGTWTYTNKSGISVSYPNGYPDFTLYIHPNVKQVKIEVHSPKNNPKDFENANKAAKLTKDTDPPIIDIRKPPEGYTWHHHEDGKTMILVDEDIHREFRHIGGQSKINGKNK